jgi:hypothetical protein
LGDSFDDDGNLRANFLQPGEDNVDWTPFNFMKKSGEDVCVQTRSKASLDELAKKASGRRFKSLVSKLVSLVS